MIKTNIIVLSTRYDIDKNKLKRYDILTFISPDNPDVTYIKRLMGLPGKTVEVKKGKVYADGKKSSGYSQSDPLLAQ